MHLNTEGVAGDDRLVKVRPVYDHLKVTYRQLYQPSQCLSVDECVLKSKARTVVKQYLLKKPAKWGIKLFAICDVNTSYLLDFDIYTGQEVAGQAEVGLTRVAILHLCQPYANQRHVIFTDNFYTSGALATSLLAMGIQLVGTMHIDRRDFPAALKNVKEFKKNSERGTMRYVQVANAVDVQRKDKCVVTMLRTYCKATD